MGISVFPSGGGGEFITNDFVVDMNDTDNNVIDLGRSYAQGSYDITLASGDTSFDIYALDTDGASVGYTNNATLITTDAFTSLVILGVATDEKITFSFSGASNNATSEGNAPGAGAYLESIIPFDLPSEGDTATVTGGNFADDIQIFFESGTVSLEAPTVVKSDSTSLIVTRPDALTVENEPYDLRAANPGVPQPTGSDVNILPGTVTAGSVPTWVTTSPLPELVIGSAYDGTLVATDPEGGAVTYQVTSGSLPSGMSLNSTTGVLSGTPTEAPIQFTATAEDDGGNQTSRAFEFTFQKASGGVVTQDGNFFIHTFESSDDFTVVADINDLEFLVVGGGGAGGGYSSFDDYGGSGGGGGAGGYITSVDGETSGENSTAVPSISVSAGTYTVTVGAGGAGADKTDGGDGGSSSFSNFATAIGGGGGGRDSSTGRTGGSGGGGGGNAGSGGAGTTDQGFAGGNGGGGDFPSGGGGGAGQSGFNAGNSAPSGDGGDGLASTITGSSVFRAGGGGGGGRGTATSGGAGGGADPNNGGPNFPASDGRPGTNGTGGGGSGASFGQEGNVESIAAGGAGGNGIVIVRYAD